MLPRPLIIQTRQEQARVPLQIEMAVATFQPLHQSEEVLWQQHCFTTNNAFGCKYKSSFRIALKKQILLTNTKACKMSVVSLLGVEVKNNPAKFGDKYTFEITFECLESLQKGMHRVSTSFTTIANRHHPDLEWKLTYVGSATS